MTEIRDLAARRPSCHSPPPLRRFSFSSASSFAILMRIFISRNVTRSRARSARASHHAYVSAYDSAPRPNGLFSCREAQGTCTQLVEVGDLSSRTSKPNRAIIVLFPDYGGGRKGRKRSPQAVVAQAPIRIPAIGTGVMRHQGALENQHPIHGPYSRAPGSWQRIGGASPPRGRSSQPPRPRVMHEVLLARAAVKRSQGRPRAKYRAAKRV